MSDETTSGRFVSMEEYERMARNQRAYEHKRLVEEIKAEVLKEIRNEFRIEPNPKV